MFLVYTICLAIRLHISMCTLTYSIKIMSAWFFFSGLGGFQKSYIIFGGSKSKYLLFLSGVGGWSKKGQKHPYVIQKWPLRLLIRNVENKPCFSIGFDKTGFTLVTRCKSCFIKSNWKKRQHKLCRLGRAEEVYHIGPTFNKKDNKVVVKNRQFWEDVFYGRPLGILLPRLDFHVQKWFKLNYLEDVLFEKPRVSVQGVKPLGSHFACLCWGFDFYEVKKILLFFIKKREILLYL